MMSAQAKPEKMTLETAGIDSESVGDPLRYRKLEELEGGLEALPRAPRDTGRVELIVARREGGRRENPDRVRLEADAGVPGDAWGRQQGPHAERAITVMQIDVAELIAEVTPMPHNGCRKFRARFGADALRFVTKPELRPRNLRGIYMRTVQGGEIAPGDPVEVIARAPLPAAEVKPLS